MTFLTANKVAEQLHKNAQAILKDIWKKKKKTDSRETGGNCLCCCHLSKTVLHLHQDIPVCVCGDVKPNLRC